MKQQMVSGRTSRTMMLIVVALLSLVFSACAAKSSAPAADEKFVFGLVLVGPINDGGWSQAHYDAAKYVESKIPGSQMVYVDIALMSKSNKLSTSLSPKVPS